MENLIVKQAVADTNADTKVVWRKLSELREKKVRYRRKWITDDPENRVIAEFCG